MGACADGVKPVAGSGEVFVVVIVHAGGIGFELVDVGFDGGGVETLAGESQLVGIERAEMFVGVGGNGHEAAFERLGLRVVARFEIVYVEIEDARAH